MVGVPGFLARFLTRFLARFLTRVFGEGLLGQKIQFYSTTGTEKYSFTVLPGQKNRVLQYQGVRRFTREKPSF